MAENMALLYRKDVFSRYQVAVPRTLDELEAAARFLHRKPWARKGAPGVGIVSRGQGACRDRPLCEPPALLGRHVAGRAGSADHQRTAEPRGPGVDAPSARPVRASGRVALRLAGGVGTLPRRARGHVYRGKLDLSAHRRRPTPGSRNRSATPCSRPARPAPAPPSRCAAWPSPSRAPCRRRPGCSCNGPAARRWSARPSCTASSSPGNPPGKIAWPAARSRRISPSRSSRPVGSVGRLAATRGRRHLGARGRGTGHHRGPAGREHPRARRQPRLREIRAQTEGASSVQRPTAEAPMRRHAPRRGVLCNAQAATGRATCRRSMPRERLRRHPDRHHALIPGRNL